MKKKCFAIKNINNDKFVTIPSTLDNETDDVTYVKFYTKPAHAKKALVRLEKKNKDVYTIVSGTISFIIDPDVKKDLTQVGSVSLSENEKELFNDEQH